MEANCKILKTDKYVYSVLVLLWFALNGYWSWIVFHRRSQYASYVHKIVMIIPMLKLIDVFAYALFLNECPWVASETYFPARYLIMTLITVSSIY